MRVPRQPPSRRHPLTGLYKADYGANGIQIVSLAYDFAGPVARIVASKVRGTLSPLPCSALLVNPMQPFKCQHMTLWGWQNTFRIVFGVLHALSGASDDLPASSSSAMAAEWMM